jgi:hypothetical protein
MTWRSRHEHRWRPPSGGEARARQRGGVAQAQQSSEAGWSNSNGSDLSPTSLVLGLGVYFKIDFLMLANLSNPY